MQPDFTYAETTSSTKARKPAIIKTLSDFPDMYGLPAQENYHSIYRFNEELVDFIKKSGGIAEYPGPCRAVGLHFDFDDRITGGLAALEDIRRFTEKVCFNSDWNITIDDLRYFFSGNKGFHCLITSDEITNYAPGPAVPAMIKKLCTSLSSEYSSFDPSVYNKTRIWRTVNSRHPASGLHKIPLYASEIYLCTLVQIKALAREQRRLSEPGTIKNYMKEHIGYAIA